MSVEGRHILVTGATSGIGLAAAKILAEAGAEVTIMGRDRGRAAKAADQIGQAAHINAPRILLADFSDLSSVRRAAQEYLESGRPLDILVNNAGLVTTRWTETADGFEEMFGVNHLAPFLLTGLLLPRMLASNAGRIVNVASDAYTFCRGINFDDLQSKESFHTFQAYGHSKLANILFTRELARRLEDRGITVNSMHPGGVSTGLGTQNGRIGKLAHVFLKPFFRSPEAGADTVVFLCEHESIGHVSGEYFYSRKPRRLLAWARDDDDARELWDVSESLVDFEYPL